MVVEAMKLLKVSGPDVFVHILTFLTIIGTLLNTYMFNPSRDKYYAMFLMRMDAKKYTLSNYVYELLKVFVGFIPFIIPIGMKNKVNIVICILIPFFIVNLKMGVSAYLLYKYKTSKKATSESSLDRITWIITIICLVLAYVLPFIGIVINQTVFIILEIISIPLGVYSYNYIKNYNQYREIYKNILTNPAVLQQKISNGEILRQASQKNIELGKTDNNKKGFEYLNWLFIQRHKKILLRSSQITAIISVLLIIGAIFLTYINVDIKQNMNEVVLTFLPYFVFIMYIINKGQAIAQAMFMNCDHSMLTYSFYKKPETILALFKIRLKSVIKINLIPASVIALGLPIILYVTGGTDNIFNYVILFISIMAMSVFFSVHNLVLYYLLQPYNANIESKSSTYSIANTITYIICYIMLKMRLPTLTFGITAVIFSILYCIISLMLVYKLAPKTFKLRA